MQRGQEPNTFEERVRKSSTEKSHVWFEVRAIVWCMRQLYSVMLNYLREILLSMVMNVFFLLSHNSLLTPRSLCSSTSSIRWGNFP